MREQFNLKFPVPVMPAPPLVPMKAQDWELKPKVLPEVVSGYFEPSFRPADRSNWVLVNNRTQTVWMSTSPMERESQSHHLMAAHGRVLVGGLGLGALFWNLLEKPEVEHIIVVERDAVVIRTMSQVWEKASAWHKHSAKPGATYGKRFTIVQGDVLRPSDSTYPRLLREHFDFGLIDIWPTVGDMKLRRDMQSMAYEYPNVKLWGAWGLELDFISWKIQRKLAAFDNRPELWGQYSDAIKVPLLGRDWPWMPALATQAAAVQALHL